MSFDEPPSLSPHNLLLFVAVFKCISCFADHSIPGKVSIKDLKWHYSHFQQFKVALNLLHRIF